MFYTLLSQPFTDADEMWLRAAAEDKFDARVSRARLYDKLPRDFEPTRIDRRFYANDKLTPIGLRRFRPDSKLLKNMEYIALVLRDKIIANPGISEIEVKSLCDELGINRLEMQEAILALQDVTQFFTGLSHARDSSFVDRLFFTGPSGYDGPLKFTSIDEALERLYTLQSLGPGLRAGNRTPSLTTSDSGALQTKSPKSTKRTHSIKKNTAFVIMAIDPARPELEDILDTIKSVSANFGITAYRADEIEHQGVITNVVLESIRECEFLIADLTYERPNVYYEIGYAHALDKKPILYRRNDTKLHFDLSVHNVPGYANARELRELLKKRFEAILGRTAIPGHQGSPT